MDSNKRAPAVFVDYLVDDNKVNKSNPQLNKGLLIADEVKEPGSQVTLE